MFGLDHGTSSLIIIPMSSLTSLLSILYKAAKAFFKSQLQPCQFTCLKVFRAFSIFLEQSLSHVPVPAFAWIWLPSTSPPTFLPLMFGRMWHWLPFSLKCSNILSNSRFLLIPFFPVWNVLPSLHHLCLFLLIFQICFNVISFGEAFTDHRN